jgi:hypothetical protein
MIAWTMRETRRPRLPQFGAFRALASHSPTTRHGEMPCCRRPSGRSCLWEPARRRRWVEQRSSLETHDDHAPNITYSRTLRFQRAPDYSRGTASQPPQTRDAAGVMLVGAYERTLSSNTVLESTLLKWLSHVCQISSSSSVFSERW